MTFNRTLRTGLLTALLLIAGASIATAETLRMGGVGAATAVVPHLFAAFTREHEATLNYIPSLGSSGGLRALNDGALDVAISGRELRPDERAQGMTPRVAVRTPYVLITSHSHPESLARSEVAARFKSPKSKWADGSVLRIVLRPKSDSDTPLLSGMFPGMAVAIEQARERPDVPVAATDQDNADLVERTPSSLAGSTFTQVKMEKRGVRFVAIDGVEPSLETLESGAYPYSKTLYFVLPNRKNALAEEFIVFLNSPAGHAALRETGNLPAAD
jgi:phosphate transport system substrate-binding protein